MAKSGYILSISDLKIDTPFSAVLYINNTNERRKKSSFPPV